MNTQNPLALLYSLNHVVRQHKKTVERMDEAPLEPVAPVVPVENVETETLGGLET